MRTHARYEQNGQQPRKSAKVKADKVKVENKSMSDEMNALLAAGVGQFNNNNDISMFNQNSLDNLNELRMKIQENLLASTGLMPKDIANLQREIKIEFWWIWKMKEEKPYTHPNNFVAIKFFVLINMKN